ncbi:DUF3140 domain-containing protein [Streptomyces sp. SID3343]|uniref:DUF3140 domain-containing protein n=1 Tax=Streptomyces sp. SID3343 TaxID=2690260 RepID=UPI001367ECCB|nr:DUF3140 domain-containing protein [Streptomyces sp. SID3343]
MTGRDDDERDAVVREFRDTVNLAPAELELWLDTPESRGVGSHPDGDAESVGHASGRRIVTLLRTRKADLTDDDIAHMRKVIGYVHRHREQRPHGDTHETPWRYSLMNWGHDPEH